MSQSNSATCENRPEKTTVKVTRDVHKRLFDRKRVDDTYNDVIQRALDATE